MNPYKNLPKTAFWSTAVTKFATPVPSSIVYVVTPSFNAASTIERTIISVVTQAGDFELNYHIQDGGSTDGTLAILKRWKSKLDAGEYPIQCKRIHFSFESKRDNGMYDAIVCGFDKFTIPRHAFMTWINADDVLGLGALSLVSNVAQGFTSDQVSWLTGIPSVMKGDTPIMQIDRPTPTTVIREGLCDGKHWHFVQQEGVFFRKWLWDVADSITNLRKYRLAGDWALWKLFSQHAEFVQVQWPLGIFRLSEEQLSRVNAEEYMAEIESTVPYSKRTETLRSIVDSGGITRRILKTRYPSGALFIVEKPAAGQAHFYYHKNFGHWPKHPLDDKELQTETVLFETGMVANPVLQKTSGEVATKISKNNPSRADAPPSPEAFDCYTYAKRSHWQFFEGVDVALFGEKKAPDAEQLKVYQDLLVLRFIRDNISPGARILDVGGGISRVLAHLAKTYECWNIDKLEGVGNGPRALKDPPYRLVRDYMGNFNPELPDNYFDFVFSISALEHVPQQNTTVFDNIITDINRVLKPGGLSLHLFDIILKQKTFWTNKFTDYIFKKVETINKAVTPQAMREDPDFYAMSEAAYNRTWFNSTNKPYRDHGLPSSLNILWRKKPIAKEGRKHGLVKTTELSSALISTTRFFVVTPCLNVAGTIDRTIQSVITQRGRFKLRYHVQDCGSTDGTLDRLRHWENQIKQLAEYSHIEFSWKSLPDSGMYGALRTGFDLPNILPEDFMTWINGGDVLMPYTFERVVRATAIRPEIEWIGGIERVIDTNNQLPAEQTNLALTEVTQVRLRDDKDWRHMQQKGMFFRKSLWFKSKHVLDGGQLTGDWCHLWRELAHHADYYKFN